jgi:hypothetical protein
MSWPARAHEQAASDRESFHDRACDAVDGQCARRRVVTKRRRRRRGRLRRLTLWPMSDATRPTGCMPSALPVSHTTRALDARWASPVRYDPRTGCPLGISRAIRPARRMPVGHLPCDTTHASHARGPSRPASDLAAASSDPFRSVTRPARRIPSGVPACGSTHLANASRVCSLAPAWAHACPIRVPAPMRMPGRLRSGLVGARSRRGPGPWRASIARVDTRAGTPDRIFVAGRLACRYPCLDPGRRSRAVQGGLTPCSTGSTRIRQQPAAGRDLPRRRKSIVGRWAVPGPSGTQAP